MLNKREQNLYTAFVTQKNITEPETNEAFLQFGRAVMKRDYENRNYILFQTEKVKQFCLDAIREGKPGAEQLAIIYYNTLLFEAQNRQLDSYLLYLERYRKPNDKFYINRRRQFMKHGVVQALQGMLDDKYDILCISMIPGSGKAQPLYSKVLTPDGFKNMGDIHVGDTVIAGNGEYSTVLGVYPQGVKKVYEITLKSGGKCRCSDEHLWSVLYSLHEDTLSVDTVSLQNILRRGYSDTYIPIYGLSRVDWSRIESIKYIGDEECQCIYIDDPCHLYITDNYIITHNTTLEEFFATGVMGWFPKDFSLFYSHSADITRMFYDSILNVLTDEQEYAWHEVFPYCKMSSTNAKAEQINIGKFKPFPTMQTTSIGASNAGKVRASKFLYCDDLIAKIEDALNKNTLDKIWNAYTVDARQRKVEDSTGRPCKEIMIATRWSVNDPIGRLQRVYADNPRVKFIAVPDIDPETGKSNFDYAVGGFTVDFFNDQALLMDDISYKCLYKQQPIEREGLLYHEDELRRYTALPEQEPDAILGVCDVKNKGTDFMSLPVVYQYGTDYYLVDCIFDDNTDFGVQRKRCGDILLDNNVQKCQFESNAGGDRFAEDVTKYVEANGGRCNITTKPTETNKETKIIVNADWVKKHVLFKSKDLYPKKSDYGRFMDGLLTYSIAGKNLHDDSPDSVAMLALFATKDVFRRPTTIIRSPFS